MGGVRFGSMAKKSPRVPRIWMKETIRSPQSFRSLAGALRLARLSSETSEPVRTHFPIASTGRSMTLRFGIHPWSFRKLRCSRRARVPSSCFPPIPSMNGNTPSEFTPVRAERMRLIRLNPQSNFRIFTKARTSPATKCALVTAWHDSPSQEISSSVPTRRSSGWERMRSPWW